MRRRAGPPRRWGRRWRGRKLPPVLIVRLLAGMVGVGIVLGTLLSAVRTVVVPRAESVWLTRVVFGGLLRVARRLSRLGSDFAWTDRVMSLYAPIALLTLPMVWLASVYTGFSLLFWLAGEGAASDVLEVTGSSLLTLGFTHPETPGGVALAFVGAAVVLAIVVLLLVTYLPAMHAAFAERERLVTMLETRAGSPPTGVELVDRFARIHGLGQLDPMWEVWEDWFARVQESHTSQPALVFFRSQNRDRSWITAAGALLDAASLFVSCVDQETLLARAGAAGDGTPRSPKAEVCIRAGYLCLRDVAASYDLAFDPDPAPRDPIAVTRAEFDAVWERLQESGVPLVADQEEAWVAFAGWRVNYDEPLLRLADLVAAPETPWVSDRSPVLGQPSRRFMR